MLETIAFFPHSGFMGLCDIKLCMNITSTDRIKKTQITVQSTIWLVGIEVCGRFSYLLIMGW